MSETIARRGLVLRGLKKLFLIYRGFGKDTHVMDVQSYFYLGKMQGSNKYPDMPCMKRVYRDK